MPEPEVLTWIAFAGGERVALGPPAEVAHACARHLERNPGAALLAFDAHSSQPVEMDLRGTPAEASARLDPAAAVRPGPGRPKLGVTAREVTLLPRHWDWLAAQPGGASVALRRLVEEASRTHQERDRRRRAQESAYRFVTALAGDAPGYEEALRALFAGDAEAFRRHTGGWPADVREHARRLLDAALNCPGS